MWIGVLSAGLRAAMWITYVGGKFRLGLPEKVTDTWLWEAPPQKARHWPDTWHCHWPDLNFEPSGIIVGNGRNTVSSLVAHDYGYPLSRYTCRATRVAPNFLDFIAFCSGVALHP